MQQKPKVKLQIVIFLELWVVITVSSFVGNSVHVIKQKRPVNHVTATRQKILRIYSAHDMDAQETTDYFLSSLEQKRCDNWHPLKMALTKTQVYYHFYIALTLKISRALRISFY